LLVVRAPGTWFLSMPILALGSSALSAVLWAALGTKWIATVASAAAPPLVLAIRITWFAVIGALSAFAVGLGKGRRVKLKRGTEILELSRSNLRCWMPRNRETIVLAGVSFDPRDETKHFKFIGTTGTGKSTAIRELLQSALDRGDRAIIADPDAGYLDRFYDGGSRDVILNPFDRRSHGWNLFAELHDEFDVEQLARALVPDTEGEDRSWRGYARTFFVAVTKQLWELDRSGLQTMTVAELYRTLTMASHEELRILVHNTPAQAFLESGNERMFTSIRSVAASSIAPLQYVARQQGAPLSLRQWVRNPTGHRALFLPYSATQIAALRSLISAWLRLCIFETMSGSDRDQRLWFVVDELDALGTIDGLKDALARLRKFGGRCVLGFQSIAQVSETYGRGEAQTIVENCANTLVLRCSASEQGGTAHFASRLIGEREVIRAHESRSRRPGEWRYTRTVSDQHVTELAVLPSEIEQLPDLAGYLKVASAPAWRRVTLNRA
jgi:type IV secretory pathway TraG/TraD family ATPase VirD4